MAELDGDASTGGGGQAPPRYLPGAGPGIKAVYRIGSTVYATRMLSGDVMVPETKDGGLAPEIVIPANGVARAWQNYRGVSVELDPSWMLIVVRFNTGINCYFSIYDQQSDLTEIADWVDETAERTGYWQLNLKKVFYFLADDYNPDWLKSPENNHLVIVRKYLSGGKVQTLTEVLHRSGSITADCYAIRFINCGRNTVMVDDLPLDNNEQFDVPGEVGQQIITKYKILFDDGSTGLQIVKKKLNQSQIGAGPVSVTGGFNSADPAND